MKPIHLNQLEELRLVSDLCHEIISPLRTIRARLRMLLSEGLVSDSAQTDVLVLCSLCSNVDATVRLYKFLGDRLHSEAPFLNRVPAFAPRIIEIISNATSDYRALARASGIAFEVYEKSFRDSLAGSPLLLDEPLFDLAFRCVLDNALKYSFSNSIVGISGHTEGQFWAARVQNRGLRLTKEEVDLCGNLGFRGSEATALLGRGRGLGLWVVSGILQSHGGFLKMYPTTKERITEVSLVIPRSGASDENRSR